MIVNWKSDGPERFVTEWRGMALILSHLPSGQWGLGVVTSRLEGVLVCNGLPGAVIRQRWATHRQAMQAIDTVMERVVARLATEGVVAKQRPRLAVQGA
jgi:hypothetical protein